ncbi:MAG TPA: segregation/condensation protein A [Patescibacteria group bacterium]|jgi:segregation and condensation protein A
MNSAEDTQKPISGFTIRQHEFEGPLDLLLQLIEERQLEITSISLAEVTDQYLARVRGLTGENLSEISDYLVIAARLVVLKSRALLPGEEVEEEEPDDLAARLAEYKLYKELAGSLKDQMAERGASVGKPPFPIDPPKEMIADGVTLAALTDSFRQVLEALPKSQQLPEKTLDDKVTIDECIAEVRDRLTVGPVGFASLFRDVRSRVRMIVTFLAVLELIKQSALTVKQEKELTLCPA